MKGDNELIDRALDAAEVTMEAEADSRAESTESTETTPEPKATQDDEVGAAIQAQQEQEREKTPKSTTRDKSGRFVKPSAKADATPNEQEQISDVQNASVGEAGAEAATEQVAAPSPTEPPAFWAAEEWAPLAKAPPEVQQAVARKFEDVQRYVSRLANESERGRALEKRSAEIFKPYELKLRAHGINDPLAAAERLLAWNDIIETDPRAAIADLMRKNGLTPDDFYGDLAQEAPLDPRVQQALDDAQEAKRLAEEQRSTYAQQQQQAIVSSIETFKSGKDSRGNIRKAFAEMYHPQITRAYGEIQKVYPNMDMATALNHAYEFVLSETTKTLGVSAVPAPAKTQEQVIQQAKKAQAAASSVSGGPRSGVSARRPSAKTIDEAIDRAEERMGLR